MGFTSFFVQKPLPQAGAPPQAVAPPPRHAGARLSPPLMEGSE